MMFRLYKMMFKSCRFTVIIAMLFNKSHVDDQHLIYLSSTSTLLTKCKEILINHEDQHLFDDIVQEKSCYWYQT